MIVGEVGLVEVVGEHPGEGVGVDLCLEVGVEVSVVEVGDRAVLVVEEGVRREEEGGVIDLEV